MFANVSGLLGNQPIQSIMLPDTVQRQEQGQILNANDPFWGGAEFIYGRATASIRQFGLCSPAPVYDSSAQEIRYDMTEVANTANLGSSVVVAMTAMTVGQYGWFCMSGVVPVNSAAAVAAGASIGIGAAGQGGAVAAGKQLLGAKVAVASTQTIVKAGCIAKSGSNQLSVPNSDGWFIGAYLSGTGIAAATTVSSISPDGRTVTLSAVTTAAVNGSVTATYNNATIFYNVVHINRPFAQGAIT